MTGSQRSTQRCTYSITQRGITQRGVTIVVKNFRNSKIVSNSAEFYQEKIKYWQKWANCSILGCQSCNNLKILFGVRVS